MASSPPRFNARSPAVKRILQEMKEMHADESSDFIAEALEGDIFEWHFVIRGPPETEFEGGVYHGRVLLPPEYPFKPPAFIMLTPSGRFETNVKICLSISSHHPEHWQPSWSIRTALTALIAFMPSPGQGALGSLDFTKEERRVLAAKAQREPPTFGSPERQRIVDAMHQRMLDILLAPKVTAKDANPQLAQPAPARSPSAEDPQVVEASEKEICASVESTSREAPATVESVPAAQPSVSELPPVVSERGGQGPLHRVGGATVAAAPPAVRAAHSSDSGLTLLAIALAIGIVAILIRKVLAAL